ERRAICQRLSGVCRGRHATTRPPDRAWSAERYVVGGAPPDRSSNSPHGQRGVRRTLSRAAGWCAGRRQRFGPARRTTAEEVNDGYARAYRPRRIPPSRPAAQSITLSFDGVFRVVRELWGDDHPSAL